MMTDDSNPSAVPSQSPPPPDLPKPNLPPPSVRPVAETPPPVVVHSDPAGAPRVGIGLGATGESEPVNPAMAPFNTRVIAALIDFAVAVGLQIALLIILPGPMERLAWAVGLGYLLVRDCLPFLGGQSVGKKAMHLKVLTLDGRPLTGNWEAGLVRNALLCLPFVGGCLEIFILLSREGKPDQGRRLGDEWAKTRVATVPVEPDAGPA